MPGGAGDNQTTNARHARAVALYREHRSELWGLARLLVANDDVADRCVRAACVELSVSDEVRLDELHDLRVALLAAARRLRRADANAHDFPLVVFALQRLTPRQRECVVLRHYAGMTEGQTSRAVGVSIGSVRTHYRRGMAHLTGWLSDVAAMR